MKGMMRWVLAWSGCALLLLGCTETDGTRFALGREVGDLCPCISSLACLNGYCAAIDGDLDTPTDGDSSDGDHDLTESELPQSNEPPPVPVIRLDLKEGEAPNPEPLSWVKLTAKDSYIPIYEDGICKEDMPDAEATAKETPFFYKWALTKYPNYASNVHLHKTTDSIDSTDYVEGKGWDKNLQNVKLFVSIVGEYEVELQVKSGRGTTSGPNALCPNSIQSVKSKILVKAAQAIHVELLWDKGGHTDMDLYLVRYRDNGTFGYSAANSLLKATPPPMPACQSNADCFGGALECGAGKTCTNACSSDAVCKQANPAWTCKNNTCQVPSSGKYIPCKTDSDCGLGHFCNPFKNLGEWVLACTSRSKEAINDTAFYDNREPRWGEYVAAAGAMTCTTSDTCLAADSDAMCGWDSSAPGKCALNDRADDPTLDIDDAGGWGPESISVKSPQPGRYRIVARFWSDNTNEVGSTPGTALTASVKISLSGDVSTFSHDFNKVGSEWKVADILWEGPEPSARNRIVPICAGWTRNSCTSDAECAQTYGATSGYSCQSRNWEGRKFCNTCGESGGTLSSCAPTKVCTSNADCADQPGGATSCGPIAQKFCHCDGASEFATLKANPYANPALLDGDERTRDPLASSKRSIWCDKASGVIDSSSGSTCSALYAP